jgi:DNA repair protein RadA/Sms
MPKQQAPLFTCTSCDAQSPKWTGQCLECGKWGTVVSVMESGAAAAPKAHAVSAATTRPAALESLHGKTGSTVLRVATGIGELDRVFGGGVIPGSVTLLGGEPGIGKSTISLSLASRFGAQGKDVVYVSGEESAAQIGMRADRLKLPVDRVSFLSHTDTDTVISTLVKHKPALAIIDSVQTMTDASVPSAGGSTAQIRTVTAKLVGFAKETGTALMIIGHVTKDGTVAGPKTLEHLVDTVFSFEGERTHGLRVLRVLKNRFGATDEAGMFEMTEEGLREVKNPSAYLLDERQGTVPGSVITAVLEGSRPVLVEVQALVQKSGFGYPTRRANGIDQARLEMLIAVLGRRGGVDLSQYDVFVNVVGGIRIKEPAADLAVAAALVSAYGNVAIPADTAAWGEVGLGGEVRAAVGSDRRLAEAGNLGMREVLTSLPRKGKPKLPAGVSITDVRSVADLTRHLMAPAKHPMEKKKAAA